MPRSITTPMTTQLKPPRTIPQHIETLRSRGMSVDDDLATQWLTYVSYYRLSSYWYPARHLDSSGHRDDTFIDGTSFTDAVHLYEADRKLSTLVFDGMERIEVAMRTHLIDQLCAHDPLAYTIPSLDQFRPTFDHAGWMNRAKSRVNRAKDNNAAIKHYSIIYGDRYPLWVLAEALDFADISLLYAGLRTRYQRKIAEALDIHINMETLSRSRRDKAKKHSPLAACVHQLTIVRNICAHHGRLWNSSLIPISTTALRTDPRLTRLPQGESRRSFGAMIIMAHLLRTICPGTTWPQQVTALLNAAFLPNPLVEPDSLGIPTNGNTTL